MTETLLITANQHTPSRWMAYFQQSHHRYITFWLQYLQDNATNHELLDMDEENIRKAWLEAAKHGLDTNLLETVEPLYHFYRLTNRLNEGQELFATAISHLVNPKEDISTLPANRQKLCGRVLTYQAWFCQNLGRYTTTESLVNRSWTFLEKHNDPQDIAFLLLSKGNISRSKHGNISQAMDAYYQSYKLFEECGDQWGLACSLNNLGLTNHDSNEFEMAIQLYEKARVICEVNNYDGLMVRIMNNIGITLEALGQFTEANEAYKKCFDVCQQLQNKVGMAFSLANQSQIALKTSRFSEAKIFSQQQLILSEEIGETFLLSCGFADLGNAYYMLEEFSLAWGCLQKGLEIAVRSGIKPTTLQLISQFAHLLYHLDEKVSSLKLLIITNSYPFPSHHLGNPTNLHEILVSELPTDELKAIQEEWQSKELDEVVELLQTILKNNKFNF